MPKQGQTQLNKRYQTQYETNRNIQRFNLLNGLDLFSGIGGISLALREWVRPIAYCEIDPYCQGVLLSRMADKLLAKAPIWDDIRTFQPFSYCEIIYGGFPCQDISIAGHGKGLAGERSGLFFEIARLCREIKPRFIFLENVPAITTRGGTAVVREIAKMGYDCRWCVISAASIGAYHKRERWFFLAHSSSRSTNRYTERTEKEDALFTHASINGNTDSESSKQTDTAAKSKQGKEEAWGGPSGQCGPFESIDEWQKAVREMGKCSHGIQFQSHRLRSIGNAVVPQQTKEAFKILMGL